MFYHCAKQYNAKFLRPSPWPLISSFLTLVPWSKAPVPQSQKPYSGLKTHSLSCWEIISWLSVHFRNCSAVRPIIMPLCTVGHNQWLGSSGQFWRAIPATVPSKGLAEVLWQLHWPNFSLFPYQFPLLTTIQKTDPRNISSSTSCPCISKSASQGTQSVTPTRRTWMWIWNSNHRWPQHPKCCSHLQPNHQKSTSSPTIWPKCWGEQ